MPVLVDEGKEYLVKYYTVEEVCEMLKTTRSTLLKWAKDANIETYKVGKMNLYPPSAIRKLIRRHGDRYKRSDDGLTDEEIQAMENTEGW